MSKFLIRVGLLLMVVAFILLIMGVLNTENSPLSSVIQAVACKPAEKLIIDTQSYSLPNGDNGQTINFFCEIEPGQQRNVTDKAILVLGGSFVVPFLVGLFMTIVGFGRKQREYMSDFSSGRINS